METECLAYEDCVTEDTFSRQFRAKRKLSDVCVLPPREVKKDSHERKNAKMLEQVRVNLGEGKYSCDLKEIWIGFQQKVSPYLIQERQPFSIALSVSKMERRFLNRVNQWKEDIGAESSLSIIMGNDNYLEIISMGDAVIPLILRELQREPAPWFLALRVLTGQKDIGKEYPGNFRKMAQAWIEWGKAKGYI